MAKGDTKTNQYLDIAANGTRADLPTDTCCETRSQTLIREVAERIMDVEDEVEEIKNNPDVVDIVPTYAALQNYDTSSLTDKDIIRVLQDETHDGDSTYYRYNAQSGTWTYVGESKQYEDFVGTDGTTAGEAGLVPAPAATDVGKFLSASGLWETIQAGGGAKELTSADYNYPTANPTGVALWLLEPGIYTRGSSAVATYYNSTLRVDNACGTFVVGGELGGLVPVLAYGYSTPPILAQARVYICGENTGSQSKLLDVNDITNNLTSTSTSRPLSAAQGKVLKDLIDSIAIRGAGAPTTSTVGEVGQLYEDGTNGALYQLKSIDITVTPNTYNWEQVGGGSSVNVVQTTGTSTTDVMSQNAVTSMMYADPSTTKKVRVGNTVNMNIYTDPVAVGTGIYGINSYATAVGPYSSASGANSVAIGQGSYASGKGAVAIGDNARAERQGVFAIGTINTQMGYNNSNYRLLTGLYDPQSDHDAATKGYVDGLISALEARIAALEGN